MVSPRASRGFAKRPSIDPPNVFGVESILRPMALRRPDNAIHLGLSRQTGVIRLRAAVAGVRRKRRPGGRTPIHNSQIHLHSRRHLRKFASARKSTWRAQPSTVEAAACPEASRWLLASAEAARLG